MKRRLRRLIVFAGVVGLVMAFNVGVASANHTGDATLWECSDPNGGPEGVLCSPGPGGIGVQDPVGTATFKVLAPVGNNVFARGLPAIPALLTKAQLVNNPLCPLHGDINQP